MPINRNVDSGAASLRIELSKGDIRIYHGTDGTELAYAEQVPEGTWSALCDMLRREFVDYWICDATGEFKSTE